jgi:endogenous inhibitor of DNA gyrase (YacG/DUF329 family)
MSTQQPQKKILRCPTCNKLVSPGDPEMPFCSDRCRVIDLGKWASGAYVISSPILDPDVDADVDQEAVKRELLRRGIDAESDY